MGYYINPREETKEEWLAKHGKITTLAALKEWKQYHVALPVCLVDNVGFSAAGICINEQELINFSRPWDTRSKVWYLVEKSLLKEWL